MFEVILFLTENQETIVSDIYPEVKQRMDVVGFFKGTDREQYLEGVRNLIKYRIEDVVREHFPMLTQEETLILFEDKSVVDYIEELQYYFTEESYVNKNTLH